MNLKLTLSSCFLFVLSGLLLSSVSADEIKLKSGETLTGRITYEADDIVKIEIPVSSTIKQTKIVGRADILEIIKEAPDNLALAKIQKFLPTPSLVPASGYETMLETGPAAFLRSFPESQHVEKVKEIQATLLSELDKVERGFIKLEEDWISPQDRSEFDSLINSRITLLRMKSALNTRNYNGIINALREFEKLEEQYYGSPAFPEGLKQAQEIVPALGNQLQSMLRDAEYRNKQYEQNLAAMDVDSRLQVIAAREQEVKNYEASIEADKKDGIKWVRLDPKSKGAIEGYLKLASDELGRIREYDLETLDSQSKLLVKADELAATGDLVAAKSILKEAAALTGKSAKSSRKGSSGSYISAISAKISEKEAEAKAKAKAREESLASEALTAKLKNKGKEKDDSGEEEGADGDTEETEGSEEEGEIKKEGPVDDFAALANVGKKKAKEETSSSKTKKKEKPEPKEREERPRAEPVDDSGAGIPVMLIIQIATGLLLITVVALKFLGKKD